MRAAFPQCSGTADVALTLNRRTYDAGVSGGRILRERMARDGSRTANTDCDHAVRAAQSGSHHVLGREDRPCSA
jgi:hypothetical protein